MNRFLVLAGLFLVSVGSHASSLGLSDLKSGDILKGEDSISKKECIAEILNISKKEAAVRLTVGGQTYQDFALEKKLGIGSEIYSDEIMREKTDEYSALITMDASLRESRFSGKKSLKIVQVNWYESTYQSIDLIDCKF